MWIMSFITTSFKLINPNGFLNVSIEAHTYNNQHLVFFDEELHLVDLFRSSIPTQWYKKSVQVSPLITEHSRGLILF